MGIVSFSDSDLKIVADLVNKSCGIIFKESNLAVLVSRLSSRIKANNLSPRDYISLLQTDNKELFSFIDFVTTNFTSFFRNPRQFEILEETFLPEVVKRNVSVKKIRIWSAGCSTGEEPYTLAMVVNNFLEKNSLIERGWTCQIVASDISLESLFTAKEGKFPKTSIEKIDLIYLARYFSACGAGAAGAADYIIKDSIKKNVRFDYHNLIYDNGIRDMDIVFCRNVLIYFDEEFQKRVLGNIHLAVKDGGTLFIGHSESLIGIYDGFKLKTLEKGIVYVRK